MIKKLDSQRYLHPDEMRTIYDWVERERAFALSKSHKISLRDTYIIETFLGSGLRRAEIAALTVGDADVATRGHATLIVSHGKGGKRREVVLTERTRNALRDWLAHKARLGEAMHPTEPLFRSRAGGHMDLASVHRTWVRCLGAAGVKKRIGVSCHAARHGYGVNLYRTTKDIRLVQDQLGHSSLDTTRIYTSLLDEDVRAGVELAEGALRG